MNTEYSKDFFFFSFFSFSSNPVLCSMPVESDNVAQALPRNSNHHWISHIVHHRTIAYHFCIGIVSITQRFFFFLHLCGTYDIDLHTNPSIYSCSWYFRWRIHPFILIHVGNLSQSKYISASVGVMCSKSILNSSKQRIYIFCANFISIYFYK